MRRKNTHIAVFEKWLKDRNSLSIAEVLAAADAADHEFDEEVSREARRAWAKWERDDNAKLAAATAGEAARSYVTSPNEFHLLTARHWVDRHLREENLK